MRVERAGNPSASDDSGGVTVTAIAEYRDAPVDGADRPCT